MALAYMKLPLQLLPGGNKENYSFFVKCIMIRETLQQGVYFKRSSEDFVTVKCCDLQSIKDCVLRPLTWKTHLRLNKETALVPTMTLVMCSSLCGPL
jgi:hypothetical protein